MKPTTHAASELYEKFKHRNFFYSSRLDGIDLTDEIEQQLIESNRRYHNGQEPLISDDEYDAKKAILKKEKPESVLFSMVGAKPTSGKTVSHKERMLSLSFIYDFDEAKEIIKKLDAKRELAVDLKYDGIAGSLVYKNGKICYAATRGDGSTGDIITHNALMAKGVPETIEYKGDIEFRGEFVLPIEAFEKLNGKYTNPRNGLAGMMRKLNAEENKNSGIVFLAYDIVGLDNDALKEAGLFDSRQRSIDTIGDWGIGCLKSIFPDAWNAIEKLREWYRCFTASAKDIHNEINAIRRSLPFEIDGVVFKADSFSQCKTIGQNSIDPYWAVAYKFPPSSGITRISSVKFQVSRTGSLTPVAKVDPVFIGGVTYTSVTLHNMDEIERLNVKIGDEVVIQRQGDVIPKIIKVNRTSPENIKITLPVLCPSCHGAVIRASGDINGRCISSNSCPEQLVQKIAHYASKDAMDIEGLAEATAKELVKNKLALDIGQLYSLTINDLLKIDGFADVSANNLINAINESKKQPLHRLVFGLGINEVGKETAKHVAEFCGNIGAFYAFSQDSRELDLKLERYSLSQIDTLARAGLKEFLKNKQSCDILHALINAGVECSHASVKQYDTLDGQQWVITGSFEGTNRDNIELMLKRHGAAVGNSVSKNTTGLIVGNNAGSKLKKAEKLGIKAFTLDQIKNILKE